MTHQSGTQKAGPSTTPKSRGNRWTFGLIIVGALGLGVWFSTRPTGAGSLRTETISQAVSTARGEVDLLPAVGRLDVGAGDNGTLIEGTFTLGRNERLGRSVVARGATQVVRLTIENADTGLVNVGSLNPRSWNVRLSPEVPMVLKVDTGVGESTLDLTALKVTNLNFKGGVGRATVRLPAQGIVTAVVESAVGQTTITIPAEMKARIRVSSDLGLVKVSGDFLNNNDTWTSPGYEGASNRVALQVSGGVGQITVKQDSP